MELVPPPTDGDEEMARRMQEEEFAGGTSAAAGSSSNTAAAGSSSSNTPTSPKSSLAPSESVYYKTLTAALQAAKRTTSADGQSLFTADDMELIDRVLALDAGHANFVARLLHVNGPWHLLDDVVKYATPQTRPAARSTVDVLAAAGVLEQLSMSTPVLDCGLLPCLKVAQLKEAWKEVAANRKAAGVKKQKLSDDEKKSDKAALLARFERCRDGDGGLTAAVVTTLGQQFSAFRLTMHVTRLLLRAMRLAERSIVPAMMRPPP